MTGQKEAREVTLLAAFWLALFAPLVTAEKIEISEFVYNVITTGDTILADGSQGQDPLYAGYLVDYEITTGILIPASLPDQQWIRWDWSHYLPDTYEVRGVLFHTLETQMSSGTVKFYVDDVECPDTSGVGVGAIGGVFNCNLKGSVFEARCTDACTPQLAVYEMKLYTKTALTVGGTPYAIEGNGSLSTYPNDIDKLFGVGSYLDLSGWYDGFNIYVTDRGTGIRAGACYDWHQPAQVSRVISITQGNYHHNYHRIQLSQGTFVGSEINLGASLYVNDNTEPTFVQVDSTAVAQSISYWRASIAYRAHFLSRAMVVGTFCDDLSSSGLPLEQSFNRPSSWSVTDLEETNLVQINMPSYHRCEGYITYTSEEMVLSFRDRTIFDNSGETVSLEDWVTTTYNDAGTRVIQVEVTSEVLSAYRDQNVFVDIVATDPAGQADVHEYFGFYMGDYVKLQCQISELLLADGQQDVKVELYADEPVGLVVLGASDSGTEHLQSLDGFKSDSCGEFSYTQLNLDGLVSPKGDSGLEYQLASTDFNWVGLHTLRILVESVDYPDYIEPQEIEIKIEVVNCQPSGFTQESSGTYSPLFLVFNMPYSKKVTMPTLLPDPVCGATSQDVIFELENELPSYIQADMARGEIQIEIEDTEENSALMGTTQKVKIKATYKQAVQTFNFAVVFMKPALEMPEPEVEEVEEEVEPEPEPEPEPGLGWDGWKALLLAEQLASNPFQLPEPITTPGYVPTPPKPTFGRISVKGESQIQFNEDVFELEDLKTATVKMLIDERRRLQSNYSQFEFAFEERPYVEVKVEPGPNSDPSKMGFSYDIYFKNAKTIVLNIKFSDPTYISANQPEDELVVTFWGPFYDQQDGLEILPDQKTVRKAIPPQVVQGGLTEAIAQAGESLQAGSTSVVFGNVVINTFLAGSLNQVWGMVNNLQIIIHSPLINVQFPGNAFMLYEVMITVATFDILPTDDLFPHVLTELPDSEEVPPFSDKFDRLEYGSCFIVMNMGTMLIIFVVYMSLYFCYPCVKVAAKCSRRANRCHASLKESLFWNHAIVFLQEGFLEVLISAVVNFIFMARYDTAWANWNLVFTNLVAIFLTVASVALTLFALVYLWPQQAKLRKKRFKKKFGSVYAMIEVRRSGWAMMYPVLFFLRRIVFVIAVTALLNYPTFQIMLNLVPTMVVMMHLGMVEPLKERSENRIEMYNSFTILCLSYCLFCFTPFVLDANARYQMGYGMILLTAQNIVVNIYIICQDPVRQLKLRCRNKWLRRRQIKRNLSLKAQKTKQFFKRIKTRVFGERRSEQREEVYRAGKTLALHTINESSNEDSFEADTRRIDRREQQKHERALAMLSQLESKREREASKTKVNKKVSEVMDFYLIDTNAGKMSKMQRDRDQASSSDSKSESESASEAASESEFESQSESSSDYQSYTSSPHHPTTQRRRDFFNNKSLFKLKQKAVSLKVSQISSDSSQQAGQQDRSNELSRSEVQLELSATTHLQSQQHFGSKIPTPSNNIVVRKIQDSDRSQSGSESCQRMIKGDKTMTEFEARAQQLQMTINLLRADPEKPKKAEATPSSSSRNIPLSMRSATESILDDAEALKFIDEESKKDSNDLAPTKMADGTLVLFPELYTQRTGVQKDKSTTLCVATSDQFATEIAMVTDSKASGDKRSRAKKNETKSQFATERAEMRKNKTQIGKHDRNSAIVRNMTADSGQLLSQKEVLRKQLQNNYLRGLEVMTVASSKRSSESARHSVKAQPKDASRGVAIKEENQASDLTKLTPPDLTSGYATRQNTRKNDRKVSKKQTTHTADVVREASRSDRDSSSSFDSEVLQDVVSLQSDQGRSAQQTTIEIAKALTKIKSLLKSSKE